MKPFFILWVLLFVLSSCFWNPFSGESQANPTGLVLQEKEGFSLQIPANWKTLSLGDIPTPKTGEVVFAVSSPEQRQGYINNIIILKAPNSLKESSQGLMKNAGNFLDTNLESYTLKDEKTLEFTDGEQSVLHTFLWKYNRQTPEIIYLQTARSCGAFNYFLTLSVAEQLENYDRYAEILKTFECQE